MKKHLFFKDVFDAVYQCSQMLLFCENVDLYRPTKSMKAITIPLGRHVLPIASSYPRSRPAHNQSGFLLTE